MSCEKVIIYTEKRRIDVTPAFYHSIPFSHKYWARDFIVPPARSCPIVGRMSDSPPRRCVAAGGQEGCRKNMTFYMASKRGRICYWSLKTVMFSFLTEN